MDYQSLPVDELRQLSAEGDQKAQGELVKRFRAANPDLIIIAGRSLIQFDNPDGHIRMALRIPEDASLDDIRQNWRIIAEWRRRLTAWQGPWTKTGKGRLYMLIEKYRRQKKSYQQIADWVNQTLVNHLESCLSDDMPPGAFLAWVEAITTLDALGFPTDEAETWCMAIVEELRAGRPPFLEKGGPVDGPRIAGQLRYWRTKQGV